MNFVHLADDKIIQVFFAESNTAYISMSAVSLISRQSRTFQCILNFSAL